jgi:multicomponent Na+:H+ antiporter subunit D
LDFDWFYRRLGPALVTTTEHGVTSMRAMATTLVVAGYRTAAIPFVDLHRPNAFLARTWSTSGMALGVMVILLAYLLAYYAW